MFSKLIGLSATPLCLFDKDGDNGGGGSKGKKGSEKNSQGKNADDGGNQTDSDDKNKSEGVPQDKVNSLVGDARKDGKKSGQNEILQIMGFENLDDLKAYAKAKKEKEDAELGELEKARKDLDEVNDAKSTLESEKANLEKKLLNTQRDFAITTEAAKQGFSDPKDAIQLLDMKLISHDEEKSEFTGIEKALKKLAEDKPYLLSGDNQRQGTPKTKLQQKQKSGEMFDGKKVPEKEVPHITSL